MSSYRSAPARRALASSLIAAMLAAAACVVLATAAPAAAASPTGDRCFVRASFQVFLDREASSSEVSTWTRRFSSGWDRSRLPDDLANSGEWLGVEVDKLYRAALDRAPDAAGRAYWIDQLRRGARVNRVGSLVYGSPEFYANAGGTAAGFVNDLYARILDRTASSADRAYWVGQVGRIGRGKVAAHFFGSVESRTSRVRALYQQILDRAPDSSGLSYWAGRLARVNDVRLAVQLASAPEFYNRHANCEGSGPITWGTTVYGTIASPGAQNTYSIPGRSGDRLSVDELGGSFGSYTEQMQLVAPNGAVVWNNVRLQDSVVTLTQNGTYRLTVSGIDTYTGTYSFRLNLT